MILFYGSPGPATISLTACGVSGGYRNSIPYLAGILFGLLLNISLTVLGLITLFEVFPITFEILKFVGIAYILYISWKLFRTEIDWKSTTAFSFSEGALLNLTNPKAYFGSMLVLEQAVNYFNVPTTIILVMVVGLSVDIAWLIAGSKLRPALSRNRLKAMNTFFAITMALVGIYGLLITSK